MKPSDLTRRVALFQSQYGSFCLWEVGENPDRVLLEGHARVSEVLEITVSPLTPAEIIAGQVRSLYSLRASVAAKLGKELASIDERIESLRALPAPDAPKPRVTSVRVRS